MGNNVAPLPWHIDIGESRRHTRPWKDAIAIMGANDEVVCYLTLGYQDGPSWDNAELIVAAVNYFASSGPPHASTSASGFTPGEFSDITGRDDS